MEIAKLTTNQIWGYKELRDKHYIGIAVEERFDAVIWCERKGMTVTRQVQDESGRVYNIWEKPGKLICAIPVNGEVA